MDRASWSVIQSIPANVGAEDSVLCLCEQRICGTLFQLSPNMYRGIFFCAFLDHSFKVGFFAVSVEATGT